MEERKFKIGDVLKDVMFPSYERWYIIDIVQESHPFFEKIWYVMIELKTQKVSQGLDSVMEHPGRFEVVYHKDLEQ